MRAFITLLFALCAVHPARGSLLEIFGDIPSPVSIHIRTVVEGVAPEDSTYNPDAYMTYVWIFYAVNGQGQSMSFAGVAGTIYSDSASGGDGPWHFTSQLQDAYITINSEYRFLDVYGGAYHGAGATPGIAYWTLDLPPGLSLAPQITAIPEPSTWAMLMLGFVGIGLLTAKRRRNKGRTTPMLQ
jgi:hypothetical protein